MVFVTRVTELDGHCSLALFATVLHFSIIGQIDENWGCYSGPLKFHLTKTPRREKTAMSSFNLCVFSHSSKLPIQWQCIPWATQADAGQSDCWSETRLCRGPMHPALVRHSFPHTETCTSNKTRIIGHRLPNLVLQFLYPEYLSVFPGLLLQFRKGC